MRRGILQKRNIDKASKKTTLEVNRAGGNPERVVRLAGNRSSLKSRNGENAATSLACIAGNPVAPSPPRGSASLPHHRPFRTQPFGLARSAKRVRSCRGISPTWLLYISGFSPGIRNCSHESGLITHRGILTKIFVACAQYHIWQNIPDLPWGWTFRRILRHYRTRTCDTFHK